MSAWIIHCSLHSSSQTTASPLSTAYKTSTSFVRSGQRAKISNTMYIYDGCSDFATGVVPGQSSINNRRSHYAIRSERDCTMLSRGSLEVVSIGTRYVHWYTMTSNRVSYESNS